VAGGKNQLFATETSHLNVVRVRIYPSEFRLSGSSVVERQCYLNGVDHETQFQAEAWPKPTPSADWDKRREARDLRSQWVKPKSLPPTRLSGDDITTIRGTL